MAGKLNRPLRRLAKRRHSRVISCGEPSSLQGSPITSAAGCHSFISAAMASKRCSFCSPCKVVSGCAVPEIVLPTATPMRLVPKSKASKVPFTGGGTLPSGMSGVLRQGCIVHAQLGHGGIQALFRRQVEHDVFGGRHGE